MSFTSAENNDDEEALLSLIAEQKHKKHEKNTKPKEQKEQ